MNAYPAAHDDRTGRSHAVAARTAVLALALVFAAIVSSGCAGVSPYSRDAATEAGTPIAGGAARTRGGTTPATAAAARIDGAAIAEIAVDMVGVPYRYGGSDPREGFDCSGLVFYAYSRSGYDVPRNSQAQFRATKKISLDRATQGDLVFFQDQQKLSHVGIYLGDNRFVHAPSSGRTVSISSLDSAYYRRHLVGVGRLLPD